MKNRKAWGLVLVAAGGMMVGLVVAYTLWSADADRTLVMPVRPAKFGFGRGMSGDNRISFEYVSLGFVALVKANWVSPTSAVHRTDYPLSPPSPPAR
jgi:hypothetical protein